VTAAIIQRDGAVLIARRAPHSKLPGKWEFPGGKVEEEESLADCLKRELFEELGILAEVGAHFQSSTYHYQHGSFQLEAFLIPRFSGEILLKDHDKVEWVVPCNLDQYELLPADIPIARKLMGKHASDNA